MSELNWSHELQFQFLKAYQSESIIWDPKHAEHKDKKKVNDAWARIAVLIGKPTKELKTKKDSLMATYRGYCRKVTASIKSGASADDVYRPVWFAFDFMNQFLSSVYNYESPINTEEVNPILEIVKREDPPTDNEGERQDERDDLTSGSTTQRRIIRRRGDPREPQEAVKQMSSLFDTSDAEDEYDLFGKLIAKKLKKIPEDEREDVMFEIEKIFYVRSIQRKRPSPHYSTHSTYSSVTSPVQSPSAESVHSFQQSVQPLHYHTSQFGNPNFQKTENP